MDSNEFMASKPKTSMLLCANFGEGKTSVTITFPKFFYIGFRQGGLEVLRKPENEKYLQNLVRYEEICPLSDEDIKDMFQPDKGKIHTLIAEATEMARNGEVETLILDDCTDAVENMQKYVWKYQKKVSQGGADDTQGMFGQLKINLSNWIDRNVVPFRKYGNVIMTTHLMRESEQAIKGTTTRAGAVDKMSDIYPDIIGSFRREIQRKFENVLYLERKPGTQKFVAYTEKQVAFGTVILAKNILGLKPLEESVTYDTLFKNKKGGGSPTKGGVKQ